MTNLSNPNFEQLQGKNKILVFQDFEEINKIGLDMGYATKSRLDLCLSKKAPAGLLMPQANQVREGLIKRKKDGIKARLVVDVTSENIDKVKELSEYFHESRHLDDVKGQFFVTDNAYNATAEIDEGVLPAYLVYSNIPVFVQQQQHIFDIIWKRAIPVKQRYKELDMNTKREFIETLYDPNEIIEYCGKIINTAYDEILLIFPSYKSIKLFKEAGFLDALKQQTKKFNLRFKILININRNLDKHLAFHENILSEMIDMRGSYIGGNEEEIEDKELSLGTISNIPLSLLPTKYIEDLNTKTIAIMADRTQLLSVEINNDNVDNFVDSLGYAFFSNSDSTLYSHISIFERLWAEAV